MKRYIYILVIFLFILSSCTLILPAMMDVQVVKVEHQDLETLAIYLRNAEDGYQVKVGDQIYDCSRPPDDPDLLVCTGPGFAPGEDLVLKFYEDGNDEPIAELSFAVPDYPDELLDTDGDGISDAEDQCSADPNKNAPGICGCGTADIDSDGDGTPDCKDGCPQDPDLTSPGEDGCKAEEKDNNTDKDKDSDSDQDGIPDSEDLCPEDPDKTEPGECGCGTPDTDTDGDGVPDCTDECVDSFSDPIGDPCDHDEDNDGVHDFADFCPLDPYKSFPGYCGCHYPETDRDNDGTPDCVDKCKNDPKKTKPGQCGCGVKDTDTDKDGYADCIDCYPTDPNKH